MKYLFVLLMFCGIICRADKIEKFFRSNPNEEYRKLAKDQIYPQGCLFPFSFYSTGGGSEEKRGNLLPDSVREADQKQIIESGVTMIGPQYELNESSLEVAARYKIKTIYSIKFEIDGKPFKLKLLDELHRQKEKLDEDKVKNAIAEIVKKAAQRPEISWWDITPEELRYWRVNELNYLKIAYQTIKENDPLKRPVFMYEPGHRSAEALLKLLPWQDLCVKGTYTNYSSMKDQRIWVRYSVEQQVEAASRASHPVTPIALTEMFRQPSEGELKLIPAWVRHDVYCSLVAGAKGVLVFSASRRPGFTSREAYLQAYLQVCEELTGAKKLGEVFLFGERRNDIEVDYLEGPKEIVMKSRKVEKKYPSVSFSNISWNNKRYVVLVNSAEVPVKLMVGGLVYGNNITVRNLFHDDAAAFTAPEGEFEVELKPLEVVAYEIFAK